MMVAGLPALLSEIGEGFILLCCPTPFPQLSHLATFFGITNILPKQIYSYADES